MNVRDPQKRRNIKLVLEYDGSGYHGWQRQAGSLSIQEVLESRLGVMLGSRVGIRASGRTDAGVHAKGQVVNRTEALAHLGSSKLDNEECWLTTTMMRALGLVQIDHQARV